MASIFKPTRIKDGKRIKRKRWYIAYKDENGDRKVAPGYIDKQATEAKAKRIELRVDRIKAGLPVDDPDGQPARPKTWQDAVEAYLAELQRRGSKADSSHVKESRRQLTTLGTSLGWQTVRDPRVDALAKWLADKIIAGMAPRTHNHYLSRLRAFLAWCIVQGWAATNPAEKVPLIRIGQKGRRRLRRAYTTEEIARLLAVAPEPRRTIYQIALYSGLRKRELKRLTREDCMPIGERPEWHLRASIDKAGRGDRVPMLPNCAELLAPLWQATPPGKPIFPQGKGRPGIPLAVTFNADLKAAGIPKTDERGRHADFHSFRYTFCSFMGRVHPIQRVRVLMRHSTIKLTADLYTDLGIDDVAEGTWTLPRLQF